MDVLSHVFSVDLLFLGSRDSGNSESFQAYVVADMYSFCMLEPKWNL